MEGVKRGEAHIIVTCLLSAFLVSCITQSAEREIPPETTAWLKRKELVEHYRLRSDYLIEWFRWYFEDDDRSIGDALRRDITERMERLRKALETNESTEVSANIIVLEEHRNVLSNGWQDASIARQILSDIGDGLSPSVKAEAESAILAYRQALKGDSWDQVRITGHALSTLFDDGLQSVHRFLQIDASLEGLGTEVSPALRKQIHEATAPMRKAMKDKDVTWEKINKQFDELPEIVFYPERTLALLSSGEDIMLGPSERQSMQTLWTAYEKALQGDNWNDVLATAEKIVEVRKRENSAELSMAVPPCLRILTIDGGGVRGIIPAMMLAEIEKETGKPIYSLFDYIVGTSTGGILALGLTRPDTDHKKPHQPRWTAQQLVDSYEAEARKIFPNTPLKSMREIIAGPKYSPAGLEDVLKAKFGHDRVGDALTNVLVTAYALETRRHIVFSNLNIYDVFLCETRHALLPRPRPIFLPSVFGPRP